MKFFLDESGDFSLPPDPESHSVGIVAGIVVPEPMQNEIFCRFRAFVDELPSSAFREGEPKGCLLDYNGRAALANLFFDLDHVLICPIMLDITSLARTGEVRTKESIVKKLRKWASLCKHETMQIEVDHLARQVDNASLPTVLRLATWARCVMRSLQDSIIRHSQTEYHPAWNELRFEIDPVRKGLGREAQIFSKMLPAWVAGWSRNKPFTLIEEVHTANHPFIQNWDSDVGVDVGAIVRNNVNYPPSHTSIGLQMADMAATLIRKAVVGLATAPDLQNYGLMMTKSIRSTLHAPGIFTLVEPPLEDIGIRYAGLTGAIAAARQTRNRSRSLP